MNSSAVYGQSVEYQAALKEILKWEIQALLQRLADTGEESVVITTSSREFGFDQLGSGKGKGFLGYSENAILQEFKRQFHMYCRGSEDSRRHEAVSVHRDSPQKTLQAVGGTSQSRTAGRLQIPGKTKSKFSPHHQQKNNFSEVNKPHVRHPSTMVGSAAHRGDTPSHQTKTAVSAYNSPGAVNQQSTVTSPVSDQILPSNPSLSMTIKQNDESTFGTDSNSSVPFLSQSEAAEMINASVARMKLPVDMPDAKEGQQIRSNSEATEQQLETDISLQQIENVTLSEIPAALDSSEIPNSLATKVGKNNETTKDNVDDGGALSVIDLTDNDLKVEPDNAEQSSASLIQNSDISVELAIPFSAQSSSQSFQFSSDGLNQQEVMPMVTQCGGSGQITSVNRIDYQQNLYLTPPRFHRQKPKIDPKDPKDVVPYEESFVISGTLSKCLICSKAVSTKNRRYHWLYHMGIKPHKCEYCGKGFSHPSNLKTHKMIHEEFHRKLQAQ